MKWGVIGFFLVTLSGCATASLNYMAPELSDVPNKSTVAGSFDQVWDRLVRNLASDFFVINNIEKSSRIINVSFSSNQPTEYVTCGTSTREFSNARGTQTYRYDPASSTQYTTADRGNLFNVIRSARLNGRANVYVESVDDQNTIVTVNTKYLIDVSQTTTNVYGNPAGSSSATFDFSTKQPQISPDGVTCIANGKLEARILQYAR
jgi:hypothetical protein